MIVLFVCKRGCCEHELISSVVSCQESLPLTKRQKNVDNFLSACRTIGVDEVRFQLSFLSPERHKRHSVLWHLWLGMLKCVPVIPKVSILGYPTILEWCQEKGKGFPYLTPSVGPGADPGVQAVSLQVTVSHPPGGRLQLPPQPQSITALWPLPSYTAWWQRHIGVNNLPKGCYAALPRAGFEPATYWSQAKMPYPLHHSATYDVKKETG